MFSRARLGRNRESTCRSTSRCAPMPMTRCTRTLVISVLTAAIAGRATAQRMPLEQRIQRVIDRPEFAHAMWGMQFTSLDSGGRVVYALNENKLFTPGSTTKLVTEG